MVICTAVHSGFVEDPAVENIRGSIGVVRVGTRTCRECGRMGVQVSQFLYMGSPIGDWRYVPHERADQR